MKKLFILGAISLVVVVTAGTAATAFITGATDNFTTINRIRAPMRAKTLAVGDPAGDIAKKITNKSIYLPAGVQPETDNPATIPLLKQALNKANPSLTLDDLSHITFEHVFLDVSGSEQFTIVPTTITVGTDVANLNLLVAVEASSSDIANKITNFNVAIASDDATLSAANISLISQQLASNNNQLTLLDLKDVTYSFDKTPDLTLDKPVLVIATIKDHNPVLHPSAKVNLQVTRLAADQKDQATVQNIMNKMEHDTEIGLPFGTIPYLTEKSETLIKNQLLSTFHDLTTQDVAYMTTMTTSNPDQKLNKGEVANDITIGIQVNKASANFELTKVVIYRSAKEIVDVINSVAKTPLLIKIPVLSQMAAVSSNTPWVKTFIKDSIINQIPQLSLWDLDHIIVPNGASFNRVAPAFQAFTLNVTDAQGQQASFQINVSIVPPSEASVALYH